LNTGTSWGVSIDPGNRILLFRTPTSTNQYVWVATGTTLTVNVGSNATFQGTGTHWITNPSSGGTYTLTDRNQDISPELYRVRRVQYVRHLRESEGTGKEGRSKERSKAQGIHGLEISNDGNYVWMSLNGIGTVIWHVGTTSVSHASQTDTTGHRFSRVHCHRAFGNV
jgi:hypothetical protein